MYRRFSFAVLSMLFASGCECSAPVQPDGGTADGGATQDAAVLCARDRDCGDPDAFCTDWRCRPGEPGTDARGCVDLGPPCEPGEACNEAMESCGALPAWCTDGRAGCIAPGNCDGDTAPSMECGGRDCDDDDRSRYPGAIEVCDGDDEDCDPSTLAGDDGDSDGDGFTSSLCCNPQGDGTARCGDDCDDGDGDRHPDAAERCNALDDDCDGSIDEDFDCAAGSTETGTNACGREGSRECDALCRWPDGYYRAEDETTCDYCADSMGGLAAERPFATRASITDLVHGTHLGSALGTCFGTSCFVDLTGARPGVVGGAFTPGTTEPASVSVGYGDVILAAEVRASTTASNPRHGWAVVAYLAPPAGGWLGTAAELGVRRDVDGWSAEWNVEGVDVVSLRRLSASGADPALQTQTTGAALPASGTATQTIALTITPDDPATGTDETRVRAQHPCFSFMVCGTAITSECANAGPTPCGYTVRPGDEIIVGVVAGTASGSEVRFTLEPSELRRAALCP